jgi:hypothetical protein
MRTAAVLPSNFPVLNTDTRMSSARPSSMCWPSPKIRILAFVTTLLPRWRSVSAKMQWVRFVPPALRPPDNSSIGCAAAAVPQMRWSCRRSTFAPHCGLRTAAVMRNEYPGKYPPRPPLCPSCAQIMRLARTTSRFGSLPDLYTYECRACGLSYIAAAFSEAA